MISEIMTSNSGNQTNSVHDELGNSPDWIELYNSSATAVSLTGCVVYDGYGYYEDDYYDDGYYAESYRPSRAAMVLRTVRPFAT